MTALNTDACTQFISTVMARREDDPNPWSDLPLDKTPQELLMKETPFRRSQFEVVSSKLSRISIG
jgi:hypothetical protein